MKGWTRTLRPYRWGDPTRLIHWRSSARYGDLRLRELESQSSGYELVIGLDSEVAWNPDWFEQAVVAAASLYFYGQQRQLVSLWTARTGLIQGELAVLEALAGVTFGEECQSERPQAQLQLWLTPSASRLAQLSPNCRWLLWPGAADLTGERMIPAGVGRVIQPDQPLQAQLQA